MFNACCEDAEGQILKIIPAHLSLCFFPLPCLKAKEILVEAQEASLTVTCLVAWVDGLSLLPIWERYTGTVICKGKKRLSKD